MGQWRAYVAETVTGMVVADVALSAVPQFERTLSDKGSWSVTLITDDTSNRGVDFHVYTLPAWYSWIVCYDDEAVQAGPVWTHGYKQSTRELAVAGSGMGGMFARRVLRNASADPARIALAESDLTYTDLSLRGIMRALVAENLSQTGYALPIDLPGSEAGSNTRTYQGYDIAYVADRLGDLAAVENGPEWDFVPVLSSNGAFVRWRMDIGTPLLGDQETTMTWDLGGALSEIDVDVNGANAPVSRAWVKGSGQEYATLVGYADDTTVTTGGFPGLDFVDTQHSSVELQATLDAYARQDLADLSAARETWSAAVRIEGIRSNGVDVSPRLGTWALGDAPTIGVAGHPWIAPGSYRRRILAFANADAQNVKLTLADAPLTA